MFSFPDDMPVMIKYWKPDEQRLFLKHVTKKLATGSSGKDATRSAIKLVGRWDEFAGYHQWYRYQDFAHYLDVQKRLTSVILPGGIKDAVSISR